MNRVEYAVFKIFIINRARFNIILIDKMSFLYTSMEFQKGPPKLAPGDKKYLFSKFLSLYYECNKK